MHIRIDELNEQCLHKEHQARTLLVPKKSTRYQQHNHEY